MSEVSDKGKKLRWKAETSFASANKGSVQMRNTLMSPDIHVLWPLKAGHRDILHEYFIPKGLVKEFISQLRSLVLKYEMNLLNVTAREVRKDSVSLLPFAQQDSFAFVLLFSQKEDGAGENQMKTFTRDLIDGVLKLKGSFYLPYRLHYSQEQIRKAYPMLDQWIAEKRKFDPEGLFTSQFYEYITKAKN